MRANIPQAVVGHAIAHALPIHVHDEIGELTQLLPPTAFTSLPRRSLAAGVVVHIRAKSECPVARHAQRLHRHCAYALSSFCADIPEGFSVIANFRSKGVGRAKRLLLAASFAIPVVGGALLAYFTLRGRSEAVKMMALVFVAGLYTLAAVEDMLREAHRSAEDSRWSALSLLGGFALFLLVSAGLG